MVVYSCFLAVSIHTTRILKLNNFYEFQVRIVLHFLLFHLILKVCFWYRYLLRRSALELFMIDRSNFFFDFAVLYLHYTYSNISNIAFCLRLTCCNTSWYCWPFFPIVCLRALKGEEMHIVLLYRLILLIWTTYILQLRFFPIFLVLIRFLAVLVVDIACTYSNHSLEMMFSNLRIGYCSAYRSFLSIYLLCLNLSEINHFFFLISVLTTLRYLQVNLWFRGRNNFWKELSLWSAGLGGRYELWKRSGYFLRCSVVILVTYN